MPRPPIAPACPPSGTVHRTRFRTGVLLALLLLAGVAFAVGRSIPPAYAIAQPSSGTCGSVGIQTSPPRVQVHCDPIASSDRILQRYVNFSAGAFGIGVYFTGVDPSPTTTWGFDGGGVCTSIGSHNWSCAPPDAFASEFPAWVSDSYEITAGLCSDALDGCTSDGQSTAYYSDPFYASYFAGLAAPATDHGVSAGTWAALLGLLGMVAFVRRAGGAA